MNFTYEEKTALYVMGVLDDLKRQGKIEGGYRQITPEGRVIYEELVAAGFEPTPAEINAVMAHLMTEDAKSVA